MTSEGIADSTFLHSRNGAESEPELPVDRPDGDAKWTPSHARLLYLISSYAVAASTAEDEETWIRSVPLTVLMYEGVVAGALDFDYAPASVLVSQVRNLRPRLKVGRGRQTVVVNRTGRAEDYG